MSIEITSDGSGRSVVSLDGIFDLTMADRLIELAGALPADASARADLSGVTGFSDAAVARLAGRLAELNAPLRILGLRAHQISLLRHLGLRLLESDGDGLDLLGHAAEEDEQPHTD